LITLYNAIAGSCAEDEANAGGGGTPPAGTTLNQLYFSDSATNGANAGCIISFFRNHTINSGPPNFTSTSGVGTNIVGLSAPTVTVVNSSTTKSAYTISATALSNFLIAAQQHPQFETAYIGIGAFLQFPNNSNTISSINSIRVTNANTNSSGLFLFNPAQLFGQSLEAPNFPQQNLLAIGNDTPRAGFTSNWGILGVGQITHTFTSNSAVDYTMLFDNTLRGGTISAGDVLTIEYEAEASGGGFIEVGNHIIEITLT